MNTFMVSGLDEEPSYMYGQNTRSMGQNDIIIPIMDIFPWTI